MELQLSVERQQSILSILRHLELQRLSEEECEKLRTQKQRVLKLL